MSDFLPKKSRRHYRAGASSSKLSATAQDQRGTTFHLKVVDSSAGGIAFIVDNGSSARFEIGQELEVQIASRRVFGTVKAHIRIAWIGEEDEPNPPHGCAFLDQEEFYETLHEDWWFHFNRRHALRVHFENEREIPAAMMGGGVSVRSRLHDLSVLGIGLYASAEAAEQLSIGQEVRVSFRLFEDREPIRFAGHVKHLTESRKTHHVGVQFDAARSPRFEERTDDLIKYVRDRQLPSRDDEE